MSDDYTEIFRLHVSGTKEEWQQALKDRQRRDFDEVARLRQANVELIVALSIIETRARNARNIQIPNPLDGFHQSLAETARAAIAKAEGTTP